MLQCYTNVFLATLAGYDRGFLEQQHVVVSINKQPKEQQYDSNRNNDLSQKETNSRCGFVFFKD